MVVVAFALLCLVFALRDFGYGVEAHKSGGELGVRNVWARAKRMGLGNYFLKRVPRTVLYLICLMGVVFGASWALFGVEWLAPRVYLGEFISFTAFGAAWMVASWDLLKGIVGRRQPAGTGHTAPTGPQRL
jgi:hypothetical protein